jgi:hypothetical protein
MLANFSAQASFASSAAAAAARLHWYFIEKDIYEFCDSHIFKIQKIRICGFIQFLIVSFVF